MSKILASFITIQSFSAEIIIVIANFEINIRLLEQENLLLSYIIVNKSPLLALLCPKNQLILYGHEEVNNYLISLASVMVDCI